MSARTVGLYRQGILLILEPNHLADRPHRRIFYFCRDTPPQQDQPPPRISGRHLLTLTLDTPIYHLLADRSSFIPRRPFLLATKNHAIQTLPAVPKLLEPARTSPQQPHPGSFQFSPFCFAFWSFRLAIETLEMVQVPQFWKEHVWHHRAQIKHELFHQKTQDIPSYRPKAYPYYGL